MEDVFAHTDREFVEQHALHPVDAKLQQCFVVGLELLDDLVVDQVGLEEPGLEDEAAQRIMRELTKQCQFSSSKSGKSER